MAGGPTRRLRTCVIALALALVAGLLGPSEVRAAQGWGICARAADMAEALRPALPDHLMDAIAKAESGRWHDGREAMLAWPWTINAEGRGQYFPSKAAAIAEVRRLQARGVESIDVGCMQVNLHYHGDAFATLQEAFDPAINMAYAAEFLLKLHRKRGSWTRAIGDYHSQTPRYSGPYRLKVFRLWRAEKKAAYREAARRRQAEAQLERAIDDYLRDDGLL